MLASPADRTITGPFLLPSAMGRSVVSPVSVAISDQLRALGSHCRLRHNGIALLGVQGGSPPGRFGLWGREVFGGTRGVALLAAAAVTDAGSYRSSLCIHFGESGMLSNNSRNEKPTTIWPIYGGSGFYSGGRVGI